MSIKDYYSPTSGGGGDGGAVVDTDSGPSFPLVETLDAVELLELSDPPEDHGPSVGNSDSVSAQTLAGSESENPRNLQHPRAEEAVLGGSYGVGLVHFHSAFTSSEAKPLDCEAVSGDALDVQPLEIRMDDCVDDNDTPGSPPVPETGASEPSSPEGNPYGDEPISDDDDDGGRWDRRMFRSFGPRYHRPIHYFPWHTHRWSPKYDQEDDEDKPSSFFYPPRRTVPTGMGAGLYNLGNTCFINAILQCFTHTVPLVKALRSHSHSLPCERGIDGFCVLDALRDLIEHSLSSSGKIIAPQNLFDNLSCISSFFRKYQQEDSHEFLQCLLDRLERCCLEPNPAEDSSSSDANNIVQQIFGGRLVSKLKCCSCGHFSDKYERLIDLSLEIEEVGNLHDAFESFTKVEMIEDSEAKLTCDGCKEKVSMEKQLMLDRAPQIATLHLKRFKSDGYSVDKIGKQVEFPLELDLTPYSNHDEDSNVNLKYQLYGVVVHNGWSPTSGHYFCYIRSSPGKWHKLDDTKVIECREEYVLSQSAYILLYARDGTPWFSTLMESQKFNEDLATSSTSPKSVLQTLEGYNGIVPDAADEVTETQSNSLHKPLHEHIEINDLVEGPKFCVDEIQVVEPLIVIDDLRDKTESPGAMFNKEKSSPDATFNKEKSSPYATFNKEKSSPDATFNNEKSSLHGFPTSSNHKTCCKTGGNDDPLPQAPPFMPAGPSTNYARKPESRYRASKEQQQVKVGMTATKQQGTKKGALDPQKREAIRYINKRMPSSKRAAQLMSSLNDATNEKNEGLGSSTCKRSRSPDPYRRFVRPTEFTR